MAEDAVDLAVCRPGDSEVAGRGLFAARDLAAGTVVLRLADPPADGRVDRLGTAFPNHGCEPTVGWLDEHTLAVMVDVAPGTELLTDYAMAITDPTWLLRCHCPSYRCRQMVEGTDWRLPSLQRRYAGWLRPAVEALVAAGGAGG